MVGILFRGAAYGGADGAYFRHGSYTTQCYTCVGGSLVFICSNCEKTGMVTCDKCMGTGKVNCTICGGRSEERRVGKECM